MRQRRRIYPVVLQLGRSNRLYSLRMHQHQALHFRFHHFAKRRPETAGLDRYLHRLAAKLPKSSASVLTARCLRPPIAITSLLFLTPSCNRISGEDLRQRGSSCASFRACASSTYSTLGGTLFWFSLHLSEVSTARSAGDTKSKDPAQAGITTNME